MSCLLLVITYMVSGDLRRPQLSSLTLDMRAEADDDVLKVINGED